MKTRYPDEESLIVDTEPFKLHYLISDLQIWHEEINLETVDPLKVGKLAKKQSKTKLKRISDILLQDINKNKTTKRRDQTVVA